MNFKTTLYYNDGRPPVVKVISLPTLVGAYHCARHRFRMERRTDSAAWQMVLQPPEGEPFWIMAKEAGCGRFRTKINVLGVGAALETYRPVQRSSGHPGDRANIRTCLQALRWAREANRSVLP